MPDFRRALGSSFLYADVFVPFGVLTFYLISFGFLLPEGVNRAFVTESARIAVPLLILLGIVLIVAARPGAVRMRRLASSASEMRAGDLLLLLFPMAPVVQYALGNIDFLYPYEAFLVVCGFALLASLLVLFIPVVVGTFGSLRPVMAMGLAFAFLITAMASMSKRFAWHMVGDLRIQTALLLSAWIVAWLILRLGSRKALYSSVLIYFLSGLVVQLQDARVGLSFGASDGGRNPLVALAATRRPPQTPSIYLLVYDAYVANETMFGYGIDNAPQEQYMQDLGFQMYPHTYSVAADSIQTMSRVLNASVDFYGNERRGVSGNGVVVDFLERIGYSTYGLFPWDGFFRENAPGYQYSFPQRGSGAAILFGAILEGEFRFDAGFDSVTVDEFLQVKSTVLSDATERPRFVYMHTLLPGHSQNSGACLPDEVEQHAERLERANLEMRRDIRTLLEVDPGAIVIVAGDHGPYLTKNCFGTEGVYDISVISRLDIQDRFGTFLAIRWPTEDYEAYDDVTVLQDLFPAVFAYLYRDERMLDTKVEPSTLHDWAASGAAVSDGIIVGGVDDGEPLFTEDVE